ncbi:MAG: SH3 domain-containing protein, partial [Anaerolineae bacterium]|nr:SH3 domain-containing protein [Anaerolineae bacterium]
MHTRLAPRLLLVSVALLAAALACNLAIGVDKSAPEDDVSVPTPAAPTVQIFQPTEGATFTLGQTVTVGARATSASGVTLVELLVNGVIVASQPPAEAVNPITLDVVLDYQPERAGTLTLAVRAYSDRVVGQPATASITILPELDSGTGSPGNTLTLQPPTATPFNPVCRARINTTLNFRQGPSTQYERIGQFSAGDEPFITGYADGPDGDGQWWQVNWQGQTGWASAVYTTRLGDCSRILPVTYLALPTATPLPTARPGETSTPSLPDLQFTEFSGQQTLQLNELGTTTANYILKVINHGGSASGAFRVAVLTPSGTLETYSVANLNPGEETLVASGNVTLTFDRAGDFNLIATVNDNHGVAESNPDNNQTYLPITVTYGLATVTPVPQATDTPFPTSTPAPLPTNTPLPQPTATTAPLPTSTPAPTLTPEPTWTPDIAPVVPLAPITAANAGAVAEVSSLSGHGSDITALTYNPAGTVLASASRDGTVRLWDAYTDAEIMVLPHADAVQDAVFSPDGSRVATVTQGGSVYLWDTASGMEVARFEHLAQAYAVALSPNGARVAVGGMNPDASGGLVGLARVWDIASGTELFANPMFGPVSGVGFLDFDTLVIGTRGQDCGLGGGGVEAFTISSGASRIVYTGATEWIDALVVQSSTGLIAASGQSSVCGGNGTVWVWHGGG